MKPITACYPFDKSAQQEFGTSVSLGERFALVGAPRDSEQGESSGGYVYEFSSGVMHERAKLLPNDGGPGDRFAYSVSVDGRRALVGAWNHATDEDGRGIY